MIKNYLWVEKYRPNSVTDYVWRDAAQEAQVRQWINDATIPHLLFSGGPGTGKTTLAKVLIHDLGVDDYDVLQINASRDNGVDFIRDKIEGFVSTMPFGEFKIVLLDEADYLSPSAQAVLRGLMETYSASARFIMTCNYPNKIIPALHSRCQGFHIERLDKTEFTARAATILVEENIDFDLDTLDVYVTATYPDLRKCINGLQSASNGGSLSSPNNDTQSSMDYRIAAVDLFKSGKIREARKLLCNQVRSDEIEEVFRWMYDNLELFSTTDEGQDRAIIIIRSGLVNHSMVADAEINLSATLCELAELHGNS
jgi:DNA polymerase III delta prime subunit